MRNDICTIPVSDVFEEKDGCPLCRMYSKVEERIVKYILGDAMMEPDVRRATNEIGFCPDHYEKMINYGNRLQLALMLETHIDEIKNGVFSSKPEKAAEYSWRVNDGCFICSKINWGVERMVATIYRMYETEPEFRQMFNEQPQFCLKHYEVLMSGINKRNMRKYGGEMVDNLNRITYKYAEKLFDDIKKFRSMYDYQNSSNPQFGESRDSVERAIKFLTMGQK